MAKLRPAHRIKRKITVRIIKSQPSMWYNVLIGHDINVINNNHLDYYYYKGNRIIFKCDVKIFN